MISKPLWRHHLPNGEGGKQAEDPQIEKDGNEVASVQIEQISGKGGPQWTGDKSVGCKCEAEYGSEMVQTKAVRHQWSRDGK